MPSNKKRNQLQIILPEVNSKTESSNHVTGRKFVHYKNIAYKV